MSVLTRLKEIEQAVTVPLLNIQDELDGSLGALGGLRNLLAGKNDVDSEGLFALVDMIEARFRRVDALIQAYVYTTCGPAPTPRYPDARPI